MLTKSKQKKIIGFHKEMQEWELKSDQEKQEIKQKLEQVGNGADAGKRTI